MKHNVDKHTFGRKQGPRKALLRGLVTNLVEHGRIKTTLSKAKELRRHVEKAITLGKGGTIHSRRLLFSRYPNQAAVKTIVDDLAVRFKSRPGGYTRIIKLGFRSGDKAEMAYIQFVDYKNPEPQSSETAEASPERRTQTKALIRSAKKSKKSVRRVQSEARRVNR